MTTIRRVDPARNMARFYILQIHPSLFGGLSLLREWGRIGRRGRVRVEFPDDAEAAAARIERAKRRKGYH